MVYRSMAMLAGLFLVLISSWHKTAPRPEKHQLLLPPANIKAFTLGYHEVVADSLWLRVVQDFDTCGKDQAKDASPVPLDAVNVDLKQRKGRCEDSWVFHMIDAITELAPDFRTAYSSGGVILSVAVDDIAGAAVIYDKAAKKFPTDWQIAFKAAYHYLYEMGNKERAAELMKVSAMNGGPYWLSMLAAKLYSRTGKALLGKAVLEDFLAKNPEKADNEAIKIRMAEIERDLAAGDDPEPTPAPESAAAAKQPTELPKKKQ